MNPSRLSIHCALILAKERTAKASAAFLAAPTIAKKCKAAETLSAASLDQLAAEWLSRHAIATKAPALVFNGAVFLPLPVAFKGNGRKLTDGRLAVIVDGVRVTECGAVRFDCVDANGRVHAQTSRQLCRVAADDLATWAECNPQHKPAHAVAPFILSEVFRKRPRG